MKNTRLFILIFSLFTFCFTATGNETDDLLEELDELILDNSKNEQTLNEKIAKLKDELTEDISDNEKFRILTSLFGIYRTYQIDSAYTISQQLIDVSANLDERKQLDALVNHAEILIKIGRPRYAIQLLNSIPRTPYIKKSLYFYRLYYTAYSTLSKEENITKNDIRYHDQLEAYTDTILYISSTDSTTVICALAGENLREGNYGRAIEMLLSLYRDDRLMKKYDHSSIEFLLAEYYMAAIDTASAKIYLAKSAINDMKKASKVCRALPRLAMICYNEDDTERAYRYISQTMYDITESHARYRILDVADYMPIISEEHDKQQEKAHQRMLGISIVLGLVLLMLIIFYILLKRKNTVVAYAERQAKEQNIKLQELSESLKISNERIRESDHIKDEYIALLFKTCSEYIHEQEDFKKKIARKLASKQISEVMKYLDQQSSESDNFRQFIRKFDMIFNSIFPTFVEDFNQLLRPEEQIKLKSGELLTPELRIYALIRLGITENSKIANFLHYSLQTVYNYRQRMRNKAIDRTQSLSKKIIELTRK